MIIAILTTILTGFTALSFEIVWHRYLMNYLGSQASATATILAVFLSGLSLGYFIFGNTSARISKKSAIKLCGFLEIGIGFWAIIFPIINFILWEIFESGSFSWLFLLGGIPICIIMIGIPTTLMGGTIPLLTYGLSKDKNDSSSIHPMIYGLNTIGGSLGAMSSGFFLIYILSLPGIVIFGGIINLIAGTVLYFCSLRITDQEASIKKNGSLQFENINKIIPHCIIAFLTGFYSLTLQSILIRLVGLTFGSSEYSFAIVIAIFILSMAFGTFIFSQFNRFRLPLFINQAIAIFGMILIYISINYWPYLSHILRSSFQSTPITFYMFHFLVFVSLGIIFLIPIGAIGATLPLIFIEANKNNFALGRTAGYLYGFNAIGCIIGTIIGGYLLLDWFNIDQLFILIIACTSITQIIICTISKAKEIAFTIAMLGIALLPLLKEWPKERFAIGTFRERRPLPGVFDGPSKFYENFHNSEPILAYKDDPNSTTAVLGALDGSRAIIVNGKSDGSTRGGDRTTNILLANIPTILQSSSSNDVAVIGYGTGMTVGSLAKHPTIESIEVLEISNAVKEFAPLFDQENGQASKSTKLNWIIGDAYKRLISSSKQYGVIISVPSNPWVTGVERLYSRETYELAKKRLAPGGIYAQWFYTYSISPETLKFVFNTFSRSFPNARLFSRDADLILIGSELPLEAINLELAKNRLTNDLIKQELVNIGINSLEELLALEIIVPFEYFANYGEQTLTKPKLAYMAGKDFFLDAYSSAADLQEGQKNQSWVDENWETLLLAKLQNKSDPDWYRYAQLFCHLGEQVPTFFNGWQKSKYQCRRSLQKAAEGGSVFEKISFLQQGIPSYFKILSNKQDWGKLKINRSVEGFPIIVQKNTISEGLGTHANSKITIEIEQGSKIFSGSCALEDKFLDAEIECEIRSQGQILYKSSRIHSTHSKADFKIEIPNDRKIELIVKSLRNNIDNAHAVWINLKAE